MYDFLLNKIITFDYGTGCIDAGATAYVYRIQEPYVWVHFRQPVLAHNDIKLHVDVVMKHGRIVSI